MNDKDPPPFGYTFSDDFFDNSAPHYDNNGQSLLTDTENQQLDNFFSSTNPFDLLDPHGLPPALDDKASAHDYNNWEEFIAPPTVHRVTSTIPDQARLQGTFHQEPHHAPSSSLHNGFLGNTDDELQAAATLFSHAQPSYANGRLYSFPEQPAATTNFLPSVAPDLNQATLPMGIQQHGLLSQRMASLLPGHSGHALDPQFPAQWTGKTPQHHQSDFGVPLQKMDLKRSYTFGTDNSFNRPSGYSGPNSRSAEHNAATRSIHDVDETHTHLLRAVAGIETTRTSSAAYHDAPSALATAAAAAPRDEDDEQSDDSASQEEQDDRPAKKRKKSQDQPGKETPKKAARNGKARKTSAADDSKRKRASAATHKTHRENLTEEQKRNNHILSEQKRRDLIKQGYKDLNEVVPAVRGGGLSKSQILVEAAAFLEKLIEDNIAYRKAVG